MTKNIIIVITKNFLGKTIICLMIKNIKTLYINFNFNNNNIINLNYSIN